MDIKIPDTVSLADMLFEMKKRCYQRFLPPSRSDADGLTCCCHDCVVYREHLKSALSELQCKNHAYRMFCEKHCKYWIYDEECPDCAAEHKQINAQNIWQTDSVAVINGVPMIWRPGPPPPPCSVCGKVPCACSASGGIGGDAAKT